MAMVTGLPVGTFPPAPLWPRTLGGYAGSPVTGPGVL